MTSIWRLFYTKIVLMVSFLHTADLHLGMRLTRFDSKTAQKIREARFQALDNLLKQASELRVEFVLVAGDLFDDDAVDLKTAQPAFEMLDAAAVPVYVLPGNHDPLLPGSVWDRPPWNQAGHRVHVLRHAEPVEVKSGVWLYPCPLHRKTSLSDPTAWIAAAPPTPNSVRIGVAHGSLKVRDDLPDDDHLIARDAAVTLKLDYLALGHWHHRLDFKGSDGIGRTAYSGVHEPMRFQGGTSSRTGWLPYGNTRNADREEFLDSGVGEALHVTVPGPGQAPSIQPIQVGHLFWNEERVEVASADDFKRLTTEIATRATPERRLLRLKLTGILSADSMLQLERLREIVKGRYFLGELDSSDLHLQPTEEEVRAAAGTGILRRVLDRLQADRLSGSAEAQSVAERAQMILYRITQETPA
jgi:DNA repair exonuclease SbcCD nuclease subunit